MEIQQIQLWREILHPYEQAVSEIIIKFVCLRDEFRKNNIYSPIESVTGRVKTVSSILEKMQMKNIPFEHLEEEVEDIAGVRIICQFVEDIERVVDLIRGRSDMEILEKKDYLANKKKSGYRSYHVVVGYTVDTIHGPKKLQVEIQIRTMAMNFWATTEHSLQYKYKGEIPEHVSTRLQKAADAIFNLDNEMSQVRAEIIDAQNDMQIRTGIVKEILSAIESLYKVASEREVKKVQEEFYRIFRLNNLYELRRFQKQLDILAEGYRVQSVDTTLYTSENQ